MPWIITPCENNKTRGLISVQHASIIIYWAHTPFIHKHLLFSHMFISQVLWYEHMYISQSLNLGQTKISFMFGCVFGCHFNNLLNFKSFFSFIPEVGGGFMLFILDKILEKQFLLHLWSSILDMIYFMCQLSVLN